MASAGYDIQYSRNCFSDGTVIPNDQISARTDFNGVDTFPTGINGANLNSGILAQYVRLMVCSHGSMSVGGRVASTDGGSYPGHGNVQVGTLMDPTMTGSDNLSSWDATPSGSTDNFSTFSTVTTTYPPALDIIGQAPQCGSQYINDSGVNANVDLTVSCTLNMTGYWAAALLV